MMYPHSNEDPAEEASETGAQEAAEVAAGQS